MGLCCWTSCRFMATFRIRWISSNTTTCASYRPCFTARRFTPAWNLPCCVGSSASSCDQYVYFKHPLAIRKFKLTLGSSRSPFPNGVIAIKYWPINLFQKLFDNASLKQSIRDGYLLNDIAFFLEKDLVELWPKRETVIDREQCTIRWKDNVIKYDYIVDADYEVPNLPDILVEREGAPQTQIWIRLSRQFHGGLPRELSNVYFIGFIRPTTGGLNNIVEMQCLFAHKMIVDPSSIGKFTRTSSEKNRKVQQILLPLRRGRPHRSSGSLWLLYRGIARLLKITPRLSDCRSLRDMVIYFLFPNTAFKYRQSGPYKVEGLKEMVQQIL